MTRHLVSGMIPCLAAAALTASFAASAGGSVIDFETTPTGGIPVDNELLSTTATYAFSSGTVSFGFDTDSDGTVDTDAVFEQTGTDTTLAFQSAAGDDSALAGFEAQLGDFFLRPNPPFTEFGLFVITYSSTSVIASASGEIWDIDGGPTNTEEFTVRAYDGTGNLLDTIVSPEGGVDPSLDGKPWVFNFTGLTGGDGGGIAEITIEFTGTKPANGIGLAFNNFTPVVVPTPAALPAGLALLGMTMLRRRR